MSPEELLEVETLIYLKGLRYFGRKIITCLATGGGCEVDFQHRRTIHKGRFDDTAIALDRFKSSM